MALIKGGGSSASSLTCTAARDTICGKGGADRISGNGGTDTLISGTVDDTFVCTASRGANTSISAAGSDNAFAFQAGGAFAVGPKPDRISERRVLRG